jgi:hypothetical protein
MMMQCESRGILFMFRREVCEAVRVNFQCLTVSRQLHYCTYSRIYYSITCLYGVRINRSGHRTIVYPLRTIICTMTFHRKRRSSEILKSNSNESDTDDGNRRIYATATASFAISSMTFPDLHKKMLNVSTVGEILSIRKGQISSHPNAAILGTKRHHGSSGGNTA